MNRSWWLALSLLLVSPALAQDADPTTDDAAAEEPSLLRATVFLENDKFTGTDRFYTNGFKLALQSTNLGPISRTISDLLSLIPTLDARPLDWGLTLGQEIYTPEDVRETRLIPNDRHYSGWLYGGLFLTRGNRPQAEEDAPDVLFEDQIVLQLGVLGEGALGEEVQNNWHKIINVPESEGWDNQLRTEIGVQIYYQRKFLFQAVGSAHELGGDLLPHIGVALGNVFTYGALGVTARLGWNIGKSFGPVQRLASAGLDAIQEQEGLTVYGFARLEGRAVLWNAFIDGTLVRDLPERQSVNGVTERVHLDRETFVADLDLGVALAWGPLTVTFTAIRRTREFEEQRDSFSFGAIHVQLTF